MDHTIKEFETKLLENNVVIEEFKNAGQFVREVVGYISNIRHTWNAAGHCFRCKVRVPEHDITFAEDNKTTP